MEDPTQEFARNCKDGSVDLTQPPPDGVDINFNQAYKGKSALHLACSHGQNEVVAYLLRHKADPTLIDDKGRTPFFAACDSAIPSRDSEEIIKDILQKLLDAVRLKAPEGSQDDEVQQYINQTNGDQCLTALHAACKHGKVSIVEWLLHEQKADINVFTQQGASVLVIAIQHAKITLAEMLIDIIEKRADVNTTTFLNQPCDFGSALGLLCAIEVEIHLPMCPPEEGKLLVTELVQRLLNVPGIDVNLSDIQGETPLWAASYTGNRELVHMLLTDARSDLQAKKTDKNTAFHIACRRGHREVAQLLLEAPGGQNLEEIQGEHQLTGMGFAISLGHTGVVQLLLSKGADVGAIVDGKKQLVAFGRACRSKRVQMAVAIYEKTSAQQRRDLKYDQFLDLAKSEFQDEFKQELQKRQEVHTNVASHEQVVLGAVTNEATKEFAVKCKQGSVDMTQPLPVDVDINDIDAYKGRSAFHLACSSGRSDLVSYLIENDADVLLEDRKGRTPFFVICDEHGKDIDEEVQKGIAQKLLDEVRVLEGATAADVQLYIERPNQYGLTALHAACESGKSSLVDWLLHKQNANIQALTNDGMSVVSISIQRLQFTLAETLMNVIDQRHDVNITALLNQPCEYGPGSALGWLCNVDLKTDCPSCPREDGELPLLRLGRRILTIPREDFEELQLSSPHLDRLRNFLDGEQQDDWKMVKLPKSYGFTAWGDSFDLTVPEDLPQSDTLSRYGGQFIGQLSSDGVSFQKICKLKDLKKMLQSASSDGLTIRLRWMIHDRPLTNGYVASIRSVNDVDVDARDRESFKRILQTSTEPVTLRLDFDINAKNDMDQTPLWIASYRGQKAFVQMLLEREIGPDLFVEDVNSNNAFHVACWRGHHEIAQLLLDAPGGADLLPIQGQYGRTGLGWAIINGNFRMVLILLSKGVDLSMIVDGKRQIAAFSRACKSKRAAIAAAIFEKTSPEQRKSLQYYEILDGTSADFQSEFKSELQNVALDHDSPTGPHNAPSSFSRELKDAQKSNDAEAALEFVDILNDVRRVRTALIDIKTYHDISQLLASVLLVATQHLVSIAESRSKRTVLGTSFAEGAIQIQPDAVWTQQERDDMSTAAEGVKTELKNALDRSIQTHTFELNGKITDLVHRADACFQNSGIFLGKQFSLVGALRKSSTDASTPNHSPKSRDPSSGGNGLMWLWICLGVLALVIGLAFLYYYRVKKNSEKQIHRGINPDVAKLYGLEEGSGAMADGALHSNPMVKSRSIVKQRTSDSISDSFDDYADVREAYPVDKDGKFIRDPKFSGPFQGQPPASSSNEPPRQSEPPKKIDFKTAIPTHVKGTKMPFGDPSDILKQPDPSPAHQPSAVQATDHEGNPIRPPAPPAQQRIQATGNQTGKPVTGIYNWQGPVQGDDMPTPTVFQHDRTEHPGVVVDAVAVPVHHDVTVEAVIVQKAYFNNPS